MAQNKPTTRLRELHGSGYEIKKGQPDIRGWDVRDNQGRKFGKVHELIFDIRANKVRYMIINVLDTKDLDLEKRTVMLPIGLAVLDGSDDDVILSTVTPFQLRALPRYDKSNLGAKAERDISHVFGRALEGTSNSSTSTQEDVDTSFYEHDHFNEDNMQKNRRSTASNPMQTPPGTQSQTTGFQSGSSSDALQNTGLHTPPGAGIRSGLTDDQQNSSLSSSETDEEAIRQMHQNNSGRLHNETDEEYIRRARKNLDR